MENLFKFLLEEQLSSVEFVQDYLQLHFDGNTLTYYIWPDIIINNNNYTITDIGYRDALCSIITHKVKGIVLIDKVELKLLFDNGNLIKLDLIRNEQNTEVIEFLYFHGQDDTWFILD